MIKSKKGAENWATDTVLFWLFFGIIAAFVAVFFAISLSQFGSGQAEIKADLENFLLISRFESTECFGYSKDSIFSVNKIDFDKFTQPRLVNCLNSEKIKKAFRISLESKDAGINLMQLTTENWNPSRNPDRGGIKKNVLVHYGSKDSHGTMTIEIQE